MSNISHEDILTALQNVRDPQSGLNLVESRMIKDVKVADSTVTFSVLFKDEKFPFKDAVLKSAETAVKAVAGVESVQVSSGVNDPLKVLQSAPPQGPQSAAGPPPAPQKVLPNAKHTIAVASGKGGVGKTTVSVNLAVSLAKSGAKVGLLDADIYGPNIPIMMGLDQKLTTRNNRIAPLRRHDVDMVSVGFISQGDAAIIWRGPLVGRMIQQFLSDVDWGELDYLIIDMPPGTGDAQLTLTQTMALTGAVIVSTPQAVALADAKKGINMFKKVEVPVLGVIENMSYFVAPDTGNHYDIFGQGGGKKMAGKMSIPFLGEIPLEQATREGGDSGTPIVISNPDSPVSQAFQKITQTLVAQVNGKNGQESGLLKRVFKIT